MVNLYLGMALLFLSRGIQLFFLTLKKPYRCNTYLGIFFIEYLHFFIWLNYSFSYPLSKSALTTSLFIGFGSCAALGGQVASKHQWGSSGKPG